LCVVLACAVTLSLGTITFTQPASSELSVEEGQRVVLVCTADQEEVVDWRNNGFNVMDNTDGRHDTSRHQTGDGKIRYTLTINNVKMTDAGVYECRDVDDPFGSDTGVTLKVNKAASNKAALTVDPPFSKIKISVGRKLHMKCTATMEASPGWYFNGDAVEESSAVSIAGSADRSGNKRVVVLTLNSARSADAGQYQCKDSANKMKPSNVVTVRVASN